MALIPYTKSKFGFAARHHQRRGTGMFDLLVSFTLLAAVISFVTPLVMRHDHLLKSHRNYRLALDELSNQLELLTALAPDQLADAVTQLGPSSFVAERLAGAKLVGEIAPAENGSRVTLHLSWHETGRPHAEATLAGWVFATPAGPAPPTRHEPEGATP